MAHHASLLETFDALGHPRVLVVGDLILDRYTWGNAERVSQEAPVILLRTDHREARLGGAANVCNMLSGLEAQVTCAGVIGSDADGRELVALLGAAGSDTSAVIVDAARPTTVKERFIGRAANRHPHQMLRVDREVCDPLPRSCEQDLLALLLPVISRFQMILISDYNKGVCTPTLLRAVIDAAKNAGVPVIVDPARGVDYQRYRGVTTMTPNRLEAELATGIKIADPVDAFRAGRQLRDALDMAMAIITLDRDGMALVPAASPSDTPVVSGAVVMQTQPNGRVFPTEARAVYDITGAGDMVLAMIGVALAGGATAAQAIELGNVAAGLEVGKVGVAIVERSEIRAVLAEREVSSAGKIVTLQQMVAAAAAHRAGGQRLVLTNGCFDLLHVGHASYLEQARRLGDRLIVAINSDASVRRLKGEARPVICQADRAAMLAALAVVDYVLVFDEDTPHELLRQIRPDVLAKGGTYTPEQVVGHEVVEAYGGQVTVTGAVDGVSTTHILQRIAARQDVMAASAGDGAAKRGEQADGTQRSAA
jgi:D-beta-D-heptose 7-phosphate kinase/D-beta-D-heptose 1-phosphate adenosyltransferase